MADIYKINGYNIKDAYSREQLTAVNTGMDAINSDLDVLTGRMDEFASLPSGSTSGNAELVDIRVGANGITYDTAGNAVRKQIDKINSAASGLVYYHCYDLLSYEQLNGFYDSTGKFVSSTKFKSFLVPVKQTDRYLFCNVNTTIVALTSARAFIAEVPRTQITRDIDGLSNGATTYCYDTAGVSGYYYVSVPYGSGYEYLRSSNNNIAVPVFPASANSDASEFEIISLNGHVLNMQPFTGKNTSWVPGLMNVATGVMGTADSNFNSGFVYVPAGTKISTRNTNVVFNLRGMYVNKNFYRSGLQTFNFNTDFFGVIDYSLVNFYWSDFAPQNMSMTEESYFIRVVPPVDRAYNQWYGKQWYSYGTSLTDIGDGDTEGNNGHSGKWPLYVDAVSGMVRHNGAIGSGGIRTSASHGGNVLQKLLQTPWNADLVTLEVLPNDGYASAANVGEITDTGTTTICGAFKTACEYITNSTRAKMAVIFITGDNSGQDAMGADHQAYIAAKNKLIAIADMYGVAVIDAEKDCLNWAKRKQGITYKDHIHLNYLGAEIYARYIWKKILELDVYPEFAK